MKLKERTNDTGVGRRQRGCRRLPEASALFFTRKQQRLTSIWLLLLLSAEITVTVVDCVS
jgi:hypothetical protein